MAIELSRRWFCLGSIAAIAAVVAKPVPIVAAPSIVPLPTTSPYLVRRICDLSVEAGFPIDRRGVEVQRAFMMLLRVAGRPIIQTGCASGSNYVWRAAPGHEIIVQALETIDFDVDPSMMNIDVGLICRDTIAKNLAMDRHEVHRFSDGKHSVTINDIFPEPFEINDAGFRVRPFPIDYAEDVDDVEWYEGD